MKKYLCILLFTMLFSCDQSFGQQDISGVWYLTAPYEEYEVETSTYYDIAKKDDGSYIANPFMKTARYKPLSVIFVLQVNGNNISGRVDVDMRQSFRNGKVFTHSVRGEINPGGDEIRLNYMCTTPMGSDAAGNANWEVREVNILLIRKN